MKEKLLINLEKAIQLKSKLFDDKQLLDRCCVISKVCVKALRQGKKIWFCGNGGSAADAQHLAAELSGRFYYDRPPLPAEALHVNTSYLTAVANDYDYKIVYSRLISANCRKGDILVALSTSGNSLNIIEAVKTANKVGVVTIGFTGSSGGKLKRLVKYLIPAPSTDTPRIQEIHMLIGHTLCETIEASIFPK